MSTPEQRLQMAKYIVDFEARRDSQGRLAVYRLPSGDGGGSYEVAGINDRYHPAMAARLRGMIEAGQYEAAERAVAEYLVDYTNVVTKWDVQSPAIEFFLRDCIFNRGPTGAAKILQMALKVEVDGYVGPQTKYELSRLQSDILLGRLRDARENYERVYAGRDESSKFWRGLENRWEKAVEVARTFPRTVVAAPAPSVPVVTPKPAAPGWAEWLKNTISGWFSAPKGPVNPPRAPTLPPESANLPDRMPVRVSGDRGYTDSDLWSPDFPRRPGFSPLVSTADRQKIFGTFEYRSAPIGGNPEAIVILGDWADRNIVRVEIPQMARSKIMHAPKAMYFHRLAADQLCGLWMDWEAAGLLHLVLTYEGSFVPRFIRGSRSVLSNHAFGTAFDINYAWNQLGATPMGAGKKGSVRELVPIAHRWGFYWGGHFAGRPDGMHFEVARIL